MAVHSPSWYGGLPGSICRSVDYALDVTEQAVLDENDVIDAVCRHLEEHGYSLEQRLETTQKGVDVIARHVPTGRRLFVEAKGGTSSRKGSSRFGKRYTQSQVFDLTSKGFLATVRNHVERRHDDGDLAALAVPDLEWYREYLGAIRPAVEQLGIMVLWVSLEGDVCESWGRDV